MGAQHEKESFPPRHFLEKRQNCRLEGLGLVNAPNSTLGKPRNNLLDRLEGKDRAKLGLKGCFLHVVLLESQSVRCFDLLLGIQSLEIHEAIGEH